MSGRSLYERLSEDPRVLESAWREVHRNARSLSKGVDNVTLEKFSAHAQRNLAKLRLDIKSGKFKFSDLRLAALPKSDGSARPIQVATINDRIVQKGIELLIRKQLNNKYNLFNNPASYAYIKTEDISDYDEENPQTHKGVKGALEKVKAYAQGGFGWALKADIVNFFPSVNSDKLLKDYIIPALAPDCSLNDLISLAFKQELRVLGEIEKLFSDEQLEKVMAHTGLPQGSILSPLFSNVYLSDFDKNISEAGFILIRYVDDFVIMAKDEDEVRRAHAFALKELSKLGLKLHNLGHEKCQISMIDDLTFLGIRYSQGNFYPSEKTVERNIFKLREYPKFISLVQNLQSLKMLVNGFASTYYFCSYDEQIYKKLNKELISAIDKTLYKARLSPRFPLKNRDLRRLGIQKFDNAVVTKRTKRK
jgi:retron-type reverse transcriptase